MNKYTVACLVLLSSGGMTPAGAEAPTFGLGLTPNLGVGVNLATLGFEGAASVGVVAYDHWVTLGWGSSFSASQAPLWGPRVGIDLPTLADRVGGKVTYTASVPLEVGLSLQNSFQTGGVWSWHVDATLLRFSGK